MAWVSPTGFNDPDTAWTNAPNLYDENTATFATVLVAAGTWGSFIELTHAALNCDKGRFWAFQNTPPGIREIDFDAFYGGIWNHVYQGVYASLAWVEKALGGTFSVTAFRFRFYNSAGSQYTAYFYEVDFNEAPAGWTGKIAGVSSPAKVMGVAAANIATVKGVA